MNEQKYFASTDGSYIDQDMHRIWPPLTATAVDKTTGKFEPATACRSPMGMGWEYLTARPAGQGRRRPTASPRYGQSYDMMEDAARRRRSTPGRSSRRKSVEPGKYDLVLDPSHLWLTIHESVGHPTRAGPRAGYEANYAGTSFATLDKWKSKNFKYGSDIVNIVADKTQPDSLGAVGYDDEGVKTKQWDLIKDGILVNYQAIRDQVHILGETESHGCCYADCWSSVQFQRMPNVSLAAGASSR